MKTDFSEQEIELFTVLGFEDLLLFFPIDAYRIAAEQAFKRNLQGNTVDALRRAMIAIEKGSPVRNSKEWDKMIFAVYENVREMDDIVDTLNVNRKNALNPIALGGKLWEARCAGKADAIAEVLSLLGRL